MKILAFNGSPRIGWNTDKLLNHALEGAKAQGAETKLFHLYDFNYRGCVSCFGCKIKGSESYGKCVFVDDLSPLLECAIDADGVIFGTPIYFGTASAVMRAFWERLLFPLVVYSPNSPSLFPKKIATGIIYTMGATELQMNQLNYQQHLKGTEALMCHLFGTSETMIATDTLQFEDYSKYISSLFDAEEKRTRNKEVFPFDCSAAYSLGERIATSTIRMQE